MLVAIISALDLLAELFCEKKNIYFCFIKDTVVFNPFVIMEIHTHGTSK